MRFSVLTVLSIAALVSADETEPARHVMVTKATGDVQTPYRSFLVQVPVTEAGFENPAFLKNVTDLIEVNNEFSYFCLPINLDGSIFGNGEAFGLDNGIHLSDTGVDLKAITCSPE
ncbi:hypothetical protein F4808DRAFT_408688 [Astrocystis sublimbata]|nr:hypothetical protein F4808DRAFT_408688 [Astrocystis sublimbata]